MASVVSTLMSRRLVFITRFGNRNVWWVRYRDRKETVTDGTRDKYSDNYWRIISPNCRQRRILFIPKCQNTAGGWRSVQQIKTKKWYKKLMLYMKARSFNHQLQLLVKLEVKVTYILFYIFLTVIITRWNFNGFCASLSLTILFFYGIYSSSSSHVELNTLVVFSLELAAEACTNHMHRGLDGSTA
jgi:hypothetical protein